MKKQDVKAKQGADAPAVSKAKVANAFEANPFYERLLETREKNPVAYKKLSPATRIAVEAYVKAKEAHGPHVARGLAA